jgi:hypothetical protein
MARRSITDAILALGILILKYGEGHKKLHCAFIKLEKAMNYAIV